MHGYGHGNGQEEEDSGRQQLTVGSSSGRGRGGLVVFLVGVLACWVDISTNCSCLGRDHITYLHLLRRRQQHRFSACRRLRLRYLL